ncbi:hypothetical protein FACS18949_04580 [Clostridia bacterium]|nr:hypothetical protein FACS189425_07390 [Clostridia bacterium]GHV32728.1 hypothetical protein FACS18949_04580 [Clostridia bacterium]
MAKLNREAIAVHVLTCSTYAEAATAAGISNSALYRLRQTPDFQETLRQVKAQMFSEAFQKAQGYSLGAIEVLKSIADSPHAVDSARVSAARTLLEMGLNAAEQEMILDRITELERRLTDEDKN